MNVVNVLVRFNQMLYIVAPSHIQLFQERLSEKVQATIPKGIVGDFEFTVFQNKFQRMAREAMDICLRVLKESTKSRFDSYSVRKSALMISHITFRDCHVHSFSDNLSRNSCIQYGHPPSHLPSQRCRKHIFFISSALF